MMGQYARGATAKGCQTGLLTITNDYEFEILDKSSPLRRADAASQDAMLDSVFDCLGYLSSCPSVAGVASRFRRKKGCEPRTPGDATLHSSERASHSKRCRQPRYYIFDAMPMPLHEFSRAARHASERLRVNGKLSCFDYINVLCPPFSLPE